MRDRASALHVSSDETFGAAVLCGAVCIWQKWQKWRCRAQRKTERFTDGDVGSKGKRSASVRAVYIEDAQAGVEQKGIVPLRPTGGRRARGRVEGWGQGLLNGSVSLRHLSEHPLLARVVEQPRRHFVGEKDNQAGVEQKGVASLRPADG